MKTFKFILKKSYKPKGLKGIIQKARKNLKIISVKRSQKVYGTFTKLPQNYFKGLNFWTITHEDLA
jgi:hypothetical protein